MARRRPSPAERARRFEREHGITPQQRRRAGGAAAVVLVLVLAVGVLVTAALVPVVGMTTHGDQRGRGLVQVQDCRARGLMRECTAVVESWRGEGPTPGSRVVVLSRTTLSGRVEVVLDTATTSTINRQQGSDQRDADRIVPAAAWVMPQWLRPVFFVAAAVVWLVVGWWLARAVTMALLRGGGGRGGTPR